MNYDKYGRVVSVNWAAWNRFWYSMTFAGLIVFGAVAVALV